MKEVIECMSQFEYNVNFDEWRELWRNAKCEDEHMIKHMWDKFVQRRSILFLWGHSDLENQKIISEIIKNLNKAGGWDNWKKLKD